MINAAGLFGCISAVNQVQDTKDNGRDSDRNKHDVKFGTWVKEDIAKDYSRYGSGSAKAVVSEVIFMTHDGAEVA